MKKILLLEGHTIESLPVLESLNQLGYYLIVLCDSKTSYGYRSKYPHFKLIKPKFSYDSLEFLNFIIELLKNNSIDIIIPLYDPSAEFLSKNKKALLNYSMFIVPDFPIFSSGFEKNKLMDLCKKHNLPHPRTCDLTTNKIESAIEYVGFPSLIKPNITSGGRGMSLVFNKEELVNVLDETINNFGECTLQEYIPFGGKQFKVQLFRDNRGEILNSTVVEKIRFYPEKGGSSCCNVSINSTNFVNLTTNVLNILNWEGFADFDLIEDPRSGEVKIMEINPRFPACIKASFTAGVDFAKIYVDYCLGENIDTFTYNPGQYLRYFGLDLLWFIKSENRFKTNPSWFKFFGKNVYYQEGSLRDPFPFIIGTFGNIFKLLNPDFRKSKSGLRK